MNLPAYQAIVVAPGFSLGIRCDSDEILGIEFLEPCGEVKPTSLFAKEVVRQLRAWLRDPHFIFSLPLRPHGTPFQRRVWAGIAAIPAGQTLTYGELAKLVKSAPRAVGGACGANPYPVIVPCHRVVAATGLGGFGGGRARMTHPANGLANTSARQLKDGTAASASIPKGSIATASFLLGVKRWLLLHEGVS
jgi:methylated-DNA-[protein]-cysteine S-methyltransferase